MNKEERDFVFLEAILKKQITLCETCDTFFDYVPLKKFCFNCRKKRIAESGKRSRAKGNYKSDINKEKKKKYDQEYIRRPHVIARRKKEYEKNREAILKNKRKAYHRRKGKVRAYTRRKGGE